ncbi:Uncharacterized protein TPAR_01952 [Tolypocladium paradoxum]|uniref:Uncharacterized protein n=1 Tax=Tolypocladium paradoxum TaxID=94208 RepID=A0A2S4L614_9HYPO|nr:Uncharacterized protein TPAR_01952 [Tolypocladium paradoxum]
MDASSSLPDTPAGGPLQTATPERVNQRRESVMSALRTEGRDSTVHDKISQFNSLSVAMQSKQLERKTADAALKRAMVGREEAEAEMRRLREETRQLQKAVQEGKERERRVGERLETVMESYGRAKETHAHTQALWEKEIRRARKENFKTQSTMVKIQEDLKSARSAVKILEEGVEREKERSRAREQEAFTARYQIVGVQEQLEQALERIKVVEQERDAFKTAAKNEEVARIAAEGRLPLPKSEDPTDEFASPKKKSTIKYQTGKDSRVSLSTMDIISSAASEMEIEELTTQVLWERQRADRAQDMVEFLQAECEMHCCQCSKSKKPRTSLSPPQKRRRESVESPEPPEATPEEEARHSPQGDPSPPHIEEPQPQPEGRRVKSKKEPRRSTIFCPREGIFRTVSEQEAEAMDAEREPEAGAEDKAPREPEPELLVPMDVEPNPRMYARTPSVDPPAFALLAQERTSLQSLLNAPHGDAHTAPSPSIRNVPTVADDEPMPAEEQSILQRESPEPRPHTSATIYTVTTTVPVRDESSRSDSSFSEKLRTPSNGSNASFDHTNPALTPTMTREQALAKIRERRGRVRSAAQAAATPRRGAKGSDRREVSAPTGKTVGRSRS